ncbi:hypothetical protein [Flavobacterium nitratireducens]|uniref:hypothetical protein n=1 Tax=Flavobacterium nitratireducens TaxID=992289 RepID=UPI002415113B|nr:hypothetical protein [Flavobacterium nitratireducens]
MSFPIIDWANKVNDPELAAFLQQYGTVHYLSAEEINELRDFVNMLSENKMDKTSLINPFLNLVIIDKGHQNGIPNIGTELEPGDVARGFFDKDTYWYAAYYLGGDPALITSWQPVQSAVSSADIPDIPNPNPPVEPPPVGTRNYSDNYSSLHYKIFSS